MQAPDRCPRCGSKDIAYLEAGTFGNVFATSPAQCETCGFAWIEIYAYTGYEARGERVEIEKGAEACESKTE